jgi:two-component system nitrate/nitrite response regulator NarL
MTGRSVVRDPRLPSPLRLVVADDHDAYRTSVTEALEHEDVWVVGVASTGRAALDAIRELEPDVAVLDMRMPGMGGAEVARRVRADRLPTRVLILSAYIEAELIADAIGAGAAGYLSKDATRGQILDAVLGCARGERVLPPGIAV